MAYKKLTKDEIKEKEEAEDRKIADLFIQGMKENKCIWQKPWKAGEYTEDYNPFSKAAKEAAKEDFLAYSGFNAFYLPLKRLVILHSEDPRWATFIQLRTHNLKIDGEIIKLNNQLKSNSNIKDSSAITKKINELEHNKLFLKEGSKGTTVRYYATYYIDENGNFIKPDDKITKPTKSVNYFKYYTVFNACQIVKYKYNENNQLLRDENGKPITETGLPPLEKPAVSKIKSIEKPESIISNSKAVIVYDQRDECFYYPADDKIHLVSKNNFKDSESYYDTVLHELIHWSGSKDRLNRIPQDYGTNKKARATEECVAEIGDFLLKKECNLNFNPKNNYAYVENWIQALNDDPKAIYSIFKSSKEAKDYIVGLSNKNNYKQDNILNNSSKEKENDTCSLEENITVIKKNHRR